MKGLRGTLSERLWARVDKTDTCWNWTGPLNEGGYGVIGSGGRGGQTLRTHRVAYELLVGPIADDLCLDHLCVNRRCCNPSHLEQVTTAANIQRGTARRKSCRRGHPFSPENTIVRPQGRECRTCRNEGKRRRADSARIMRWIGGDAA
jgi:hypothetical protein